MKQYKKRFVDQFPFNTGYKWVSVCVEVSRNCNLENLEINAFVYLTFNITDRYKICIGIWKLIHKEQKIGLFIGNTC